uniref:Uncharacterized protein n=1 Tax=Micrurus spixii TaxID=129469 RepID=A0A2D4MQB6_9SAUR
MVGLSDHQDDVQVVPMMEEILKVLLLIAVKQWSPRGDKVGSHHHQQVGGVVGEDIIKHFQPFFPCQDFREHGFQKGPGIALRGYIVLHQMVKKLFVMMCQDVFHHAEDIDGRVWEKFKPVLTPIDYYGSHHLEADELIVLEEFDKGKNQQRDVRHLTKDGGPVSQARKSPL